MHAELLGNMVMLHIRGAPALLGSTWYSYNGRAHLAAFSQLLLLILV